MPPGPSLVSLEVTSASAAPKPKATAPCVSRITAGTISSAAKFRTGGFHGQVAQSQWPVQKGPRQGSEVEEAPALAGERLHRLRIGAVPVLGRISKRDLARRGDQHGPTGRAFLRAAV